MSDTEEVQAAFPDRYRDGMTLRDYFAAKAMQGMLAGLLAYGHDIMWDQVAKDAYKQADAMLKARET
jgi:hypothetical protein